ncbi:FAD-dependent oxidoreductase [Actinopolymorpha sp. B11F2]|uniref:NAD(P)/FAD-dependent oxidoreductase n=1 Tax=Actinopolymorpha sp. B11F2 TaxID=3160862 RepID=UPI0032E3C2A6
MSQIVVVGGGFAAVWSAAAAARRRAEAGRSEGEIAITVIAPSPEMVIRPRLYEENPSSMTVLLDDVLSPIGVRRVQGTVRAVDPDRHLVVVEVDGDTTEMSYDRLVLATGSRLVPPPSVPGADLMHDVDTRDAAADLERHLDNRHLSDGPGRFRAVVVGSGFVGLEVATELVDRLGRRAAAVGARDELRVWLVERAEVVAPELGEGPRDQVLAGLAGAGVDLVLGSTVASMNAQQVTLADGRELSAETVVWTGGMRAHGPIESLAGDRDVLGRLEVDARMFVVGVPDLLAAGDVASVEVAPGRLAPQSCQYAHQHGKHAGHNAVADLLGLPLLDFNGDPYVTVVDLGSAGAVYTEGFDRQVRAVGKSAKDVKRMVNTQLIYPPTKDADVILTAADHLSESRPVKPVPVEGP